MAAAQSTVAARSTSRSARPANTPPWKRPTFARQIQSSSPARNCSSKRPEEHFGDSPFILKPNRGGKGLGVRLLEIAGCARRPSRQPRLPAAGRRPPSAAAICARPAAVDHPRGVRRRPVHVCGRGRHRRRLRTLPGRCLRRRRRFLPGRRTAARQIHDRRRHRREAQDRYETFLAKNDIEVAGIKFVTDAVGTAYTYDVNTNTNYNPDAEARAGRSGMDTLARYLGAELSRVSPRQAAAK